MVAFKDHCIAARAARPIVTEATSSAGPWSGPAPGPWRTCLPASRRWNLSLAAPGWHRRGRKVDRLPGQAAISRVAG